MQINFPKRRKKTSLFSQQLKDSEYAKSQGIRETSIVGKVVTSLREINLKGFCDCYYRKDFGCLVLSGVVSQEKIEESWEKIKFDYCDAIGGINHKVYFKCFQDLLILRTDKEELRIITEILLTAYSEPFAQQLNEICETRCDFNPIYWDKYLQDIKDCSDAKMREINIELKLKQIQFDNLSSDNEGEEVTEDDLYETLIDISDHKSINLDDKISMFDYCRRINKMKNDIKLLNENSNGREH